MKIGEKIRLLRKQKGISPEKLGKMIDMSGIYIRRLEKEEKRTITLTTATKLARGLGVPVAALLDEADLPPVVTIEKPLKMLLHEAQQKYEAMELVEIPVRGIVPAGYPYPSEQESGEFIEVPRQELGGNAPQGLYALKISGDSLQGDEIYSGDYAVVLKEAGKIIDGKIYIVRLGNECVARHVFKLDESLRLVASNGEFKEMLAAEVEILGRVILTGRWKRH